jgi:hypothetical protein
MGRLPGARDLYPITDRPRDRAERQGQCARLLRRRHAPRRRARGARVEEGGAGVERDLPRRDARFLGNRAGRPVRRRGGRSRARSDHRARRHPAGLGSRVRVLEPARQRPRLAVRGEQLPAGRGAGGLRHPLLECRQHQPARPDVLLLPSQYVSIEQVARAGGARELRRSGRARQSELADLRARHTRRPHRPLALGLSHARASRRRGQDLRAGRERPHRRRGQSGVQEPAQLLDRCALPIRARRLA